MEPFTFKEHYTVEDLRQVVRILRAPDGCPWDSVQTHQSIRRNFIEETLEACEAIDREDATLLREELGDVLFQVMFHADIEANAGRFDLDDAADTACKKMIFRHPHVFGTEHFDGLEPELARWEELKRQEKGQDTYGDTLDAVARTLPGLWRAEKLQKKAAKAGFTWPDTAAALGKLREETDELTVAVADSSNVAEELGDVLFAAAGVAVQAGLDPEECLRQTCEKYIQRFRQMEDLAQQAGTPLDTLPPDAQLSLWEQAKSHQK
ncbi:MAG: nucleoside triphosphate pyrophosphohydrolase [Oscillospiraceae bacterium]|nr:nucleoside triphosphate pyrophosphohydrolase [Oscillospiraceae bacterium]